MFWARPSFGVLSHRYHRLGVGETELCSIVTFRKYSNELFNASGVGIDIFRGRRHATWQRETPCCPVKMVPGGRIELPLGLSQTGF